MRATEFSRAGRMRREGGFSMVELSVAMVIALFLLAGLFTIQQSTRNTSTQQNLLSQLQDNERLAMTMMTDVIQSAGYFADPTAYTVDVALPQALAPAPEFDSGQGVFGKTTAGHDSVYVQFMSQGPTTDNMIMCNGQQTPNTAPAGVTYVNQFSVDIVNKTLLCTVSTNVAGVVTPIANQPVVLVENVEDLKILYGVATKGTNANSVDTYMTADQIQALRLGAGPNRWPDVSSVKVTVTFTNPLYGQPGQTQANQKTVQFGRVIGIMGRSGGS